MNPYTDVGHPPVQISPNDVDMNILPQGVTDTQQGMGILQVMFALYVTNVTCNAVTPARIRYLNYACENGFQNNEVTIACSEIMDFVRIAMADGRSWQQMLDGFVAEVILFRVAFMIANDQYLQSILTPEQLGDTEKTIQAYQAYKLKVQQYRNGTTQNSMMGNRLGNSAGGTMMGRALAVRSNPGAFASPGFVNNSNLGNAGSRGVDNNPKVLNRYTSQKFRNSANQNQNPNLVRHHHHGEQLLHSKVAPPVAPEPEIIQKALTWSPHTGQSYFLLYDPTVETYEIVEKNGKIFYELRDYKEGEVKVERSNHQIKSVENIRRLPPSKWASRQDASESTMIATSLALTKPEETQTEEEKEFISKNIRQLSRNVHGVDSIAEAVQMSRLIHKRVLGQDYVATCFRSVFDVRHVYVTVGDFLPVFKTLASYGNLAKISLEMNKLAESNTDVELAQCLARLDRYLAKHVTSLIRGKLGLTFGITSFMEDVGDIEGHMLKNYGQAYVELYHRHQSTFIEEVMNFKDFSESQKDTIQISNNDDAELNYFGPEIRVTVTSMDLLASELKLGFYNEKESMPAMIRESSHPHLYQFAKATLDSPGAAKTKASMHFISTADDVLYTLIKGAVGTDSYLIRKA